MQHPISSEHSRAFHIAVCKRLGLDPANVRDNIGIEVTGGDEKGRVLIETYLPADELMAMFNEAGREQASQTRVERLRS